MTRWLPDTVLFYRLFDKLFQSILEKQGFEQNMKA